MNRLAKWTRGTILQEHIRKTQNNFCPLLKVFKLISFITLGGLEIVFLIELIFPLSLAWSIIHLIWQYHKQDAHLCTQFPFPYSVSFFYKFMFSHAFLLFFVLHSLTFCSFGSPVRYWHPASWQVMQQPHQSHQPFLSQKIILITLWSYLAYQRSKAQAAL